MTNETKFTPGPWHIYQSPVTPMPDRVDIVGQTRDDDIAENVPLANANLIAAAPDLYVALEDIVDSVAMCEGGDEVCQTTSFKEAKQALAKARGEYGQ